MPKLSLNSLVYAVNPFRVFNRFVSLERDLENYFSFGSKMRIGMDIGNYAIKTVLVKPVAEGYQLSNYAIKEVERPLDGPGEEIDEVAVTQALRELLSERHIKAKRVNLSISDPSLYTRQIKVAKTKKDQLNRVIRQAAEKYIPFSIDEAIVDYQPIESLAHDSDEMEIFIVAAKKAMVQKYLTILHEVKLAPNVMDISIFPATKLLADIYLQSQEAILPIVDIGHHSTTVAILNGSSLRFVRNFHTAGHHFTSAIASAQSIQEAEAEKIKRSADLYPGQGEAQSGRYDIRSQLEPVLNDFVGQIQRCFAYCERDFMIENIGKIIICGGGSLLKGLDRYLEESLGVKIERGDPLQKVPAAMPPEDSAVLNEQKPVLCAALGLATCEFSRGQ